MPEEEVEQREGIPETGDNGDPGTARGRRYFTRRNALLAAAILSIGFVLLALFAVVIYRYGVFDPYIKQQLVNKLGDMGLAFDADVFRVTVNPLEVELKNATFNDKLTGDKIAFIRDAHLKLSVKDLFAWQLSRDISLDTTDINGAEVWVKFDESGKSNFSNLHFVEGPPGSINFLYQSVNFSLRDSVVHIGDLSRKIDANANNVAFFLEPEDYTVSDDQKRYKISFTSKGSNFNYDGHQLENIDIDAKGLADHNGADISQLNVTTPIGSTNLSGRVDDWTALKYNLNVDSSVDLTQASTIFPLGSAIRGVGNFKGTVTGQGENYNVNGTVDSQAITAAGIYLKGANIEATVQGTNSAYDANGKAVAEMLTFEDFQIDFPKLTGHVRGTGTDFRWVGELQAIAAKSPDLTLGGLFLADAVAEYEDKQFSMSSGRGEAKRFQIGDTEFADLIARNMKLATDGKKFKITSPTANADSFSTKDYALKGLNASGVEVKHEHGRTDVTAKKIDSTTAQVKGAQVKDVEADDFSFIDLPKTTTITGRNVKAANVTSGGVSVSGVEAPKINVEDNGAETVIYSDKLRVAKLDAGSAVLGSLNIAGVRLSIRQGTVTGRTEDIDAGNVQLTKASGTTGELDSVKIAKPVFVVEPSGRYRATADMSIGGGIIGQVSLGAARANVNVNNDRIALSDLTADVMNGNARGNANIALNKRTTSEINGDFNNLDVAKLLALGLGRVIPANGDATGNVNLTFPGTDLRGASGTLKANINANAGDAASGLVPITGRVELNGTSGLFNIDTAKLNSAKSELSATGRIDLKDQNSALGVALNSTDASEIDRLIRVLGFSPEIQQQIDANQVAVAGNLHFSSDISGNITDPIVNGKASIDSVDMRGTTLGSIAADIAVSPDVIDIKNGRLTQSDGGNATFDVNIPATGSDNTSVNAKLTNISAANLIAALPVADYLPAGVRDFSAKTSGTVNISGLPNKANGNIDISSGAGTVSGQNFDSLAAKATFQGTLITLENFNVRSADGFVAAKGTYDRATTEFNIEANGKNIILAGVRNALTQNPSIPAITGLADLTAKATGRTNDSRTYDINFNGTARSVSVNENPVGDVIFKGITANQMLNGDLTADINGHQQIITASVNFADPDLPFRAETNFDQTPLEPYFAFSPMLSGQPIGGMATGHVSAAGNLSSLAPDGTRVYSTAGLSGSAELSQLNLHFQDTPLNSEGPVSIKFNSGGVDFNTAKFSGGGSNITISGSIALNDAGSNNFAVDGRINLNLLNLAVKDTFFAGFADVGIRLVGPAKTSVLSGNARVDNGSVATFIGSDRITLDRIRTTIIFTSNQAQIERATGFLGGGRFTASGGALLNGLSLQEFRFDINGTNVTVPLPTDFITTGDAVLEVSGRRLNAASGVFDATQPLQIGVGGRINARRSLYSKDINLSNVVGVRRDTTLSSASSGSIAPIKMDLTVEGRDALVVHNNVADLTASVSLRVTGDSENPQVSGRITADSGTIFFRKDRYTVQRAVLDFPPETTIEPILNLQAETEISGYQIFLNLSGSLIETDQLTLNVRSSPALPQADVVSLITTGSLSNTEGGIGTLAQSGINTAAEVLTDAIINNPARKATDKLFGLNVFEIDPIISGERLNPSARLTVGRQINNNLRVTYSTNLSQDQNQVLAFEYRVSNKLSFVAQYEQRSLNNVTRNRDNFSFEVRFRRRF